VWRYAGSLDVRCVRTCVCNPAAVKGAEELHARSKGYLTSVNALSMGKKVKLSDMLSDTIIEKDTGVLLGVFESARERERERVY
jgi:hypothetical protein